MRPFWVVLDSDAAVLLPVFVLRLPPGLSLRFRKASQPSPTARRPSLMRKEWPLNHHGLLTMQGILPPPPNCPPEPMTVNLISRSHAGLVSEGGPMAAPTVPSSAGNHDLPDYWPANNFCSSEGFPKSCGASNVGARPVLRCRRQGTAPCETSSMHTLLLWVGSWP